MNNGLLLAKGIHKSYDNNGKRVKAVDGIDLALNAGRSTAFIGPSGAGKSTLLHILGGLDRPTSGHVMLNGVDIYKLPDRERASIRNRRVGFVFQFYHLLPEFTALENVMMPEIIKNQKLKCKDRNVKERAGEALKLVGLANRMTHRPGELSGGESQRVAIARAIINKPEVLLCDEPTGNLDSATSESVYELLFGLKESYALTLVIVTHDEKLSKRTDEVIRMKDGKINLP